jgi:hypothetical protein
VPQESARQPVDIALELASQPGLAHPGGTRHRHQPGHPALDPAVQQVLEQTQVTVASDERRLQARLTAGADLDPQGAP